MSPFGLIRGLHVTFVFISGDHKMQSYARNFEIFSQSGELLFSADENEVTIGAEKLTVTGNFRRIFNIIFTEACS